ncbi:MAG: Xaa-Pro peptidase family protein [Deinococcota bacterium]
MSPMHTHPKATPIPESEYQARRERILQWLPKHNANGFVWWGNTYIFYLCGFAFAPTERPIGLVISASGETVLFVPRLEVEHAEAYAYVDRVVSYPEYPSEMHPMTYLADVLKQLDMDSGTFLGDGPGYGMIMGYRGPSLPELLDVTFKSTLADLDTVMYVKSEHEVALIRESAYWASVAHQFLQDYTKVGLTESDVSMRAGFEAGQQLLAHYEGAYKALSWGGNGPMAIYRGQIGEHSALPHSLNINAVFKAGDTLVTGASCPMFGYYSELERTMFMGEPSSEQRRLFDHMLALQDLAIAACVVGKPCASVDQAVRDYIDTHNLWDNWRHHVGHNIGIRYHEGPFLDIGDETIMESGMLFTVEPGLYAPGVGGFRHSDTILVTDSGPEFLTLYPRDLNSLILPVD